MKKIFAKNFELIWGIFLILFSCPIADMDGLEAVAAVDYSSALIGFGAAMAVFGFGCASVFVWIFNLIDRCCKKAPSEEVPGDE